MIEFKIPGRGKYEIENIVLDYNGTIAVDGVISSEVKKKINELSELVNVYVLTADTYGTVFEECRDLKVNVQTFPNENAAVFKRDIVQSLKGQTICIGNGYNDIEMFKISTLSIAIIGDEGCSGKLINCADIIVNSIEDALTLIMKTDRIKATLRN